MNEHDAQSTPDGQSTDADSAGRRRGIGSGLPFGPGARRRGFGRGPGPGPRSRARRGAVGRSILVLLAERPMHGYEIISALAERTNGAWKPSAGSVYPALERLTEKGLIGPVTDGTDEKQRFGLTTVGSRRVAEMAAAGVAEPWTEVAATRGGDLRSAAAELVGPLRQIGRFGTPAQITAAKAVVSAATVELYQILAAADDDTPSVRNTDPDPQ